MVEVRIVFVEEFADHHHFAIFQFNHRLQRHAFVIAFAHVADKPFDVVIIVNLFDAQIFRSQQDVQFLTRFDSEIDVYIALPTFYAGADALFIKPFNDGRVKAVNFADKTGDKQVFGSS